MVESESDGEIKYQQLRHIYALISIPIHQATITFVGFLLFLRRPRITLKPLLKKNCSLQFASIDKTKAYGSSNKEQIFGKQLHQISKQEFLYYFVLLPKDNDVKIQREYVEKILDSNNTPRNGIPKEILPASDIGKSHFFHLPISEA